jgi:hypothetical protein
VIEWYTVGTQHVPVIIVFPYLGAPGPKEEIGNWKAGIWGTR